MNWRTLGRRIATARKTAGMTQAELAEKAEVSVETIGRIERGTVATSLETLERIAGAVDVELADLVRARERGGRREAATTRVLEALRRRPLEEVELVADLLEFVARR